MIGQTISHYKILDKLGEGGMGVVYKAQDTKLDRTVALKFLPEHVSVGSADLERFTQEAKAAAGLNHPNICTIYGIEEADNKNFIVMEFVDGQTLQEKKTSLSMKQALDIGIQIAEGLAAAHEKGIVHRDIKPENIMFRKDGRVQIMDFGLAKLRGASRLTKEGSTVGTAGYMSPEQVQGQETDHRSDIFSLGVLLYEMLTGQPPFKGVHETAISYEIVNVDSPPLSSIKPEIAPELDAIVLECLEKDPKERTQSASQVAVDLKRYRKESSKQRVSRIVAARSVQTLRGLQSDSGPAGAAGKKSRTMWLVTAAVVFLALGVLAILRIWNVPTSDFTQPVHFSFDIPGQSNPLLFWESVFNISPDGQSIAYVDMSESPGIINIRRISSLVPFPVRGTEGGRTPVFENNKWLSFTRNKYARRIPIQGGVPDVSLSEYGEGFSWGSNGEIISGKYWASPLYFQTNWQSIPEAITEIEASLNESAHLYPVMLPGNTAAVFTIWSKDGTFDDSRIGLIDLKTKTKKHLSYNGVNLQGTNPGFIRTAWNDYLLWTRDGHLYASSFDLSDLIVTGPEIKILEGIVTDSKSGKATYAVAGGNNGTIAYIPGRVDTAKNFLVWVDKNGRESKAISRTGSFIEPTVSRNGRALVVMTSATYKIGLVNFQANKVDLVFESGDNDMAKITPDGSSFVFSSNHEDGKYYIYMSRLDGIGGATKILDTPGYHEISELSADGSTIFYTSRDGREGKQIWSKNMRGNQRPELLFEGEADVTSPAVSPDGRLLAYRSNEIGGKFTLFIRPLPINNTKVQVSVDDGHFPQWSADGTEIYYRTDDKILASRILTKPELQVVSKRLVCSSKRVSFEHNQSDFAVAPDGRILLVKSAMDQSQPVKVNVILNWFTELKSKLTGDK